MSVRATEGTILAQLVVLARPHCRAAQRLVRRRGPGAPPAYPDWKMALLIMVAVAARRKSKSAQYRYLAERRSELMSLLRLLQFPARSTYFERYRHAYPLFVQAVRLQGRAALRGGLVDGRVVTVDKSLLAARGRAWYPRDRRVGRRPRELDDQAAWSYSAHHGWVYGYSYEVVVSAAAANATFPLLISVDRANRSEHRSFKDKIPALPRATRYVLADAGYDDNASAEAIEYDRHGQLSGRRHLCHVVPFPDGLPHGGYRSVARRRAGGFAGPQGKRIEMALSGRFCRSF